MAYNNLFTVFESAQAPPIITDEIKKAQQQYNEFIEDPFDVFSIIPSNVSLEEGIKSILGYQDSPFDNKTEMPDFTPTNFKSQRKQNNESIAEKAIDFAQQFVGTNYLWGGISPKTGFDCSGIGYYSFKQFGVNMPRTAKEMAKFGKEVPIDQVQKGDWIVTTSGGKSGHHVVWVTGRGPNGEIEVINAKGQKDGIISSTFTDFKKLVSARRLDNNIYSNNQSKQESNFEQAFR